MKQRSYLTITGVVFSIIFALQALRLIAGWEAMIGGWQVPIWPSWIAAAIAGYLAYNAFSLGKKAVVTPNSFLRHRGYTHGP